MCPGACSTSLVRGFVHLRTVGEHRVKLRSSILARLRLLQLLVGPPRGIATIVANTRDHPYDTRRRCLRWLMNWGITDAIPTSMNTLSHDSATGRPRRAQHM